MASTEQTHSVKSWLQLLAVSLIWGSSFMSVTLALGDLSPLQVAASRVGIGAVALWVLMRVSGVKFPPLSNRKLWKFIAAVAVLSTTLPFFLLSWSQQYVPSAFAGTAMATVPLFTLPLAHLFIAGEQMNILKIFGFGIGFIGTMILIGTGGLQTADSWAMQMAQIACVVAAVCYAANSIIIKKCPPIDKLALAAGALILSFTILLPLTLIFDGIPSGISTTGFIAILYLGIIPTAFTHILQVNILQTAGPSFLSLVSYQIPVWSVVFGAVFMGESLPKTLFIALGLILLSLIFSQWASLKKALKL